MSLVKPKEGFLLSSKSLVTAFIGVVVLMCASVASAQTLTSNSTGNQGGHFYSFWKDSGNASMTLHDGGRYSSEWSNSTNNGLVVRVGTLAGPRR
jgi:hypothetical protein